MNPTTHALPLATDPAKPPFVCTCGSKTRKSSAGNYQCMRCRSVWDVHGRKIFSKTIPGMRSRF